MWIAQSIVAEIEEVARLTYIDVQLCQRWNRHRGDGELRLLTGWAWIARANGQARQGFKTKTVAMRDAYYTLIRHQEAEFQRPRLRVVKGGAARKAA